MRGTFGISGVAATVALVAFGCGKSQPPAGGNIPENGACQRSLDCQGSLSCVDQKCTQVTPAAVDQSACQCPNGRPCSASGRCLESGCRSGLCDLNGNPDDGCEACCPTAGGQEVCDGVDNNCDGKIDEGVTTTFYLDADEDGFGDDRFARAACVAPKSHVPRGGDCNDDDPAMRPGLAEQCDGKDNDCNGQVDDNVTSALYADRDRDGYGDPAAAIQGCVREGFVSDKTDCDDSNPLVNPGRTEICDQRDNNCNGTSDEGLAVAWYADADLDGYGDPAAAVQSCAPPPGFIADKTDCNDRDPTMNPGRTEVCDYRDNNCDGTVDEGVAITFYRDADGDGFGNPQNTVTGCQPPAGFLVNKTDCDDARPDVHPGAQEQCNNRDDDCDGTVDGHTRACANDCGTGTETCLNGIFAGCTAPVITAITTSTRLAGQPRFRFDCLEVRSSLELGPDVTVETSNFVRVASGATIAAAPRTKIEAGGDISFLGRSWLAATEITLQAVGAVSLESDSRWYITGAAGVTYSGGGGAACLDSTTNPVGGAGGGARGGDGGKGGTCGALTATLPTPGAGGARAQNGSPGCNCSCSSVAAGGNPSGGQGGAPTAGGGGGGAGGAGGAGSGGSSGATSYPGGTGGLAESAPPAEPIEGGSGGGSAGRSGIVYASQQCGGAGGAGGGWVRAIAASFVNRGIIFADGAGGSGAAFDNYGIAGGGGGGGGGTLIFRVARFENLGALSALGGNGSYGGVGGIGPACSGASAGGGGGGGGGRIFIAGPLAGGAPNIVTKGNLLVAAGAGGTGACGRPPGGAGAAGWIYPP